jgi:hypothetical protein
MNALIKDPFRIRIEYDFEFEDGARKSFLVDADLTSREVHYPSPARPRWAELDFLKCEHCSLDSASHPHCPAAVSIQDLIEYFSDRLSYSRCRCTVRFNEKTVIGEKPLQDALFSLIGLRMATSVCPYLSRFRPMARFHEPFSTPFYTVYRALSFFLIEQYFRNRKRGRWEFDLDDLKEFYANINRVNNKMSRRLREAEVMDAAPNSITILSVFGTSMTVLFEEYLKTLETLFRDPGES